MAFYDYLNNIKFWKAGKMNTVNFYVKMLNTMPNSQLKIGGVRYGRTQSCYLGDISNGVMVKCTGDFQRKGDVNKYTRPSDNTWGGCGISPGAAYNQMSKSEVLGYTNVVAYLQVTPVNGENDPCKYAPCVNFLGGGSFEDNDTGGGGYYNIQCARTAVYGERSGVDLTTNESRYITPWRTTPGYVLQSIKLYGIPVDSTDGKRVEIPNVTAYCPLTFDIVYEWARPANFTSNPPIQLQGQGVLQLGIGITKGFMDARNLNTLTNWRTYTPGYTYDGLMFQWLNDTVIITGEGAESTSSSAEWADLSGKLYPSPFPNVKHYCRFLKSEIGALEIPGHIFNQGGQIIKWGIGYYSNYPKGQFCSIANTPEDFETLIADWGIPCSTDLEKITSGEDIVNVPPNPSGGNSGIDPDFPPYGPGSELPEDVPQDDMNKIDDFDILPPNITPASLCDSYVYNFEGVRKLFNWFCSTSYIQNQSELFADKLSAIYGLMLYPFDLVGHDSYHTTATSSTTIVKVSSPISGYILNDGYNTIIEGGYIDYNAYYGDYNDWTNCAYSVYIPYGGVTEIPASAVVNRRLKLSYALDLMSGKATAVLRSYSLKGEDDNPLGVLVKMIPCQIGTLLPVQSSNFAQREISNTLALIGYVQGGVGANVTQGTNTVTGAISSIANGYNGQSGALKGSSVVDAVAGATTSLTGMVEGNIQRDSAFRQHMTFNQQLSYCATGAMSPATGMTLPQTPYLTISRAKVVKPGNYDMLIGVPTLYSAGKLISDFVTEGEPQLQLAQFAKVVLNIPSATIAETKEIEQLLLDGVYM